MLSDRKNPAMAVNGLMAFQYLSFGNQVGVLTLAPNTQCIVRFSLAL